MKICYCCHIPSLSKERYIHTKTYESLVKSRKGFTYKIYIRTVKEKSPIKNLTHVWCSTGLIYPLTKRENASLGGGGEGGVLYVINGEGLDYSKQVLMATMPMAAHWRQQGCGCRETLPIHIRWEKPSIVVVGLAAWACQPTQQDLHAHASRVTPRVRPNLFHLARPVDSGQEWEGTAQSKDWLTGGRGLTYRPRPGRLWWGGRILVLAQGWQQRERCEPGGWGKCHCSMASDPL